MQKPESQEYKNDSFFEKYIVLATGTNALEQLQVQKTQIIQFYTALTETQLSFAYEPNKWTIKEMLGHITDTERILQFRLLSALRGEQQPLIGFNENDYMEQANFKAWTLESLLENYVSVREQSILLLKSATDSQLANIVTISDYFASGLSLTWFMVGHEQHHIKILQEKYKANI
jgi:uncharacterized damage-inducible protein DinB